MADTSSLYLGVLGAIKAFIDEHKRLTAAQTTDVSGFSVRAVG